MLKSILFNLKIIIRKYGYKVFLPLLYLLGLVVSILLTLLSYIFPSLIITSSGFMSFGLPLGWLVAIFLSLPGYYIFDVIEKFFLHNPANNITLIGIFLISIMAYYLIGFLIDIIFKILKR